MELVEGDDLSKIVAAGSKVPALHRSGAPGNSARDLKPQNIKGRQDGTVKVLDFGLACRVTVRKD